MIRYCHDGTVDSNGARMALLDRLLPAWRHSDPEVRASAVRGLGKDSRETLASIAQRDDDVRVRRIAVKRLDDPELLLEIGRTDPDEELRSLATAHAEDLLVECAVSRREPEECTRALALLTRPSHRVTVATRAFHPSARRAALSSVSEERALAEIARRGDDRAIGLEALSRITDAALLRRIAAGDAPSEVALAALGRLGDPDLLHAIAEDPQAQKVVRKRARAMLALVLSDDHPIRVAERRERQMRLCDVVAGLRDEPDPAAASAALRDAQKDWQDLCAHAAPDPEVEDRFQRACQPVLEAIARAQQRDAEERKREAARQQARITRQQLCETVESLEGPEIPERLETARAEWRALSPSDDRQCHELATRFAQALERCEQRHQRWQVRNAFRSQVEALVSEAERLVQSNDPQAAARPRAVLEKRWSQLGSSPAGMKWLADERALQRRFVEAGEALKNQEQSLRTQRERREKEARGQLTALCTRLEQQAKADTIAPAAADRALSAAADALQHLGSVHASERKALRQRLAAAQETLERRIHEQAVAEDWKRWANADLQQKLIEQAEALLAADDPRQALREIGRLEQEWKRFGVAPRGQSQALWERFRNARDELRRRAHAYLSENLTKKEALCAAVERLADSTEWNDTAAAIRRMQAEWKQIGPVRQKISAALFERFRAPANRFFERRQAYLLARKERRKEMLGQMRTLCETAEGLADSTDWDVAAAEIKQLQAAALGVWGVRSAPVPSKVEGPGLVAPHAEMKPSQQQAESKRISPRTDPQSDALWNRFRAACDRFFDRYRRRGELELEARLARAEAILADLESLRVSIAAPDAPTPDHVTQQLNDDLAEWRRLGSIPPDKAKALNQRLQAACDALEAACPDGLHDEALGAETNIKQREKLCVRFEQLVASLAASADEASASDLAERLQLALAAHTIGGSAMPSREQALRAVLETVEGLKAKWQRLGPVVGARARALVLRFEKSSADFVTYHL